MRMKPPKWMLLSCALMFMTAVPTQAQEDICKPDLIRITDLRPPSFTGGSHVWDILYAQDGMDVFADAVPLDNNEIVAGGAFTKDKDDSIYHPLLVKFDERFKPIWEIRTQTKEQRTIHRLLQTKDGFTVLGDMADGIYIASYTSGGKLRGAPVPIRAEGGELDAKAFVPAQDGSGYLIAAQFIDAKDQEIQKGFVYKLSKGGKILWKRHYTTGNASVIHNIQTVLDGSHILSGQMVMDDGKSSAWVIRIDDNGAVKWQKDYPRGGAATFTSAQQTKDGHFIFTGKARPLDYDGNGLTAWVMKTDAQGKPLWERYLKGPYDHDAPSALVYEDGRASVLVNAGAMDSKRRSHARLVTFSPQGDISTIEDFVDGQNAASRRLVSGRGGERIIVGYAQTNFGDDQATNEAAAAPAYTYDGWLLAADPLTDYNDPCAAKSTLSPILP